jgi:hypothetical protein
MKQAFSGSKLLGVVLAFLLSRIIVLTIISMLATHSQVTELRPVSTDLTIKNTSSFIAEHAVIIPYRNRSYHLERFMEEMGPYFRRNFPNELFSLWIIEQADNQFFNRGWLANVGIAQIGLAQPHCQCIIFHDVDLIPELDGAPYNQCTLPSQLSSELEHFKWGVPYQNNFGGVMTMHMNHWRKINGFSNDYVGWGGKDDDFFERIRINCLLENVHETVHRPPKGMGRFKTISQSSTDHPKGIRGKEEYAHSLTILEEMRRNSDRWKTDGLLDMHYTIIEHKTKTQLSMFASVHHIKCTP